MLEFDFREFKKLRRLRKQKGDFRIELSGSLSVVFYEIGEVSFKFIRTNSFPMKADNEGCTVTNSHCP